MTEEALGKPAQGLALNISEQLKQLIYTGEIQPGERLNEAALALRMGVSRGPIREAIRILAGSGIVTAVVNKGVFVKKISVREMLDVYELRALVFGFAAQRAVQHITEEHRRRLEALLVGMDDACEQENGTRYYELNLEFHAMIMALGKNERSRQLYNDLVNELHLFRRGYFNSPGNMRKSNAEHRQIYDAIISGAENKAKSSAERHVLSGHQRLLKELD